MNKARNSATVKGLTNYILTRFFITLTIYTIVMLAVFGTAYLFLSSKIWYYGDPFYDIFLHPINQNKLVAILFCWIVGFLVIFTIYWKKTIGYIDAIAQASKQLTSSNDELIQLPDELKHMQDDMNSIKQDAIKNARLAQEAEQRKNDLIVYLAHDLKTPLTSVIGYLTLLKDEQKISDELREKYLSISLEKAERLEDLINEFFEITRFNLSKLTLDTSRINLTRMLEQIAYEFRPMLADKNLQYSLDAPSDIEIKCDANKLERVFDNLMRNAINYSFENSTIEIMVIQNSDGVTIHFLNHGNTIPSEKLNRLFEQFYRLDVSRATKTGGAGLGLAIAKEIVELHHGTITASSENEQIEFVIHLPILP